MKITTEDIQVGFHARQILKGISIESKDKELVGIIGPNGSGKSTLLKCIYRILKPDAGAVYLDGEELHSMSVKSSARKMAVVAQHNYYNFDFTVREVVLMGRAPHKKALERDNAKDYRIVEEALKTVQMDAFADRTFSTLSGGEQQRVILARALAQQTPALILDEPTNHLDMEAIRWLENYLLSYNGSVIIVAHDRYFLDKIVTKIIEIDRTKTTVFSGNYTAYAEKKKVLRNMQLKEYLNQQRNIKHQEAVITKLKQFNREKSIKRAESREKMLDKIELVEKPEELNDKMNITLNPKVVSGNDVLHVEELTKSFDGNTLFSNISFDIKRGERIAIIGNNGTGKTTMLKIINGLIPADHGTITLGSKVTIGYYDQEQQVLDPDKTLFEEIQDAYPDLNNTQIRNTLAAFLFTNDDVFKYIRDLSGGERGRVSLAKLMLSNANFLILDEPTNHLDMVSKEILENALNNYTGTVLYVSHDRYFINTTATRIIELTNKMTVNYIGNYDYYLEKKDILTAAALKDNQMNLTDGKTSAKSEGYITNNKNDIIDNPVKDTANLSQETASNPNTAFNTSSNYNPANASGSSKDEWKQSRELQNKLKKMKNELKKTEERISEIEDRLSAIDEESALPEVCSDTARLLELHKEHVSLSEELEKLYEKWEDLSEQLG